MNRVLYDTADPSKDQIVRSAVISACGLFRYTLRRQWSPGPTVVWCLLNASTADGSVDDHTVRKGMGFSRRLGFGSMVFINLFAFRARFPADMREAVDPVGPLNDQCIVQTIRQGGTVIAAWGPHGAYRGCNVEVLNLLRANRVQPYALHVTRDGHPGHPLMLPYSSALTTYRYDYEDGL